MYPRILFFINGVAPSLEEELAAEKLAPCRVAFRNANYVSETGALEICDGVYGEVPERYKKAYKSAEDAMRAYVEKREAEHAAKAQNAEIAKQDAAERASAEADTAAKLADEKADKANAEAEKAKLEAEKRAAAATPATVTNPASPPQAPQTQQAPVTPPTGQSTPPQATGQATPPATPPQATPAATQQAAAAWNNNGDAT